MQANDIDLNLPKTMEMLIDNMHSAVLVVDYEFNIRVANKLAVQFANRLDKEVSEIKSGDVFKCNDADHQSHTADSCVMCLTAALVYDLIDNQLPAVSVESNVKLQDHSSLDLKIKAINLPEDKAVLVIIDDQTELKALERDRKIKERLEEAMKDAGVICHEMNQPLQVISGYLDLLMTTCLDQDVSSAKYLSITREQMDRLTKIVRKLNILRKSPG